MAKAHNMTPEEQQHTFGLIVAARQADKTLEPLPIRVAYADDAEAATACPVCDPYFDKPAGVRGAESVRGFEKMLGGQKVFVGQRLFFILFYLFRQHTSAYVSSQNG